MAIFNRFSDLPGELRTLIWSFAIRDLNRAGVHIFSLCDRTKKLESERRCMVSLEDSSTTFSEPLPSRYFEGASENVSTYLIDGGLWTACKESRSIMQSYFRRSEWVLDPSLRGSWSGFEESSRRMAALSKEESLMVSTTGNFFGTPFYQLTTLPNRDPFVLQADCLDDIEWRGISFDYGFGCDTLWASRGLSHIGIEFDPGWWDSQADEWDWNILKILKDAAHEVYCYIDTIWIIDHGLKKKKGAPENLDIHQEFYTSDRKLVEVDWRNIAHFINSNPVAIEEGDWLSNNRSIDLVEFLKKEIYCEADPGLINCRSGGTCSIYVLGWDDLDSWPSEHKRQNNLLPL